MYITEEDKITLKAREEKYERERLKKHVEEENVSPMNSTRLLLRALQNGSNSYTLVIGGDKEYNRLFNLGNTKT